MHLCAFICIYNPKYKQFRLYTVSRMYVFRADYLLLENQLVCSYLGKTISSTLSVP